MKLATLKLGPQQIEIAGPSELVQWIDDLRASPGSPEAKLKSYNEYMKDWYVVCAVTGEPVAVPDIKYWNVERGEVYKSAQVMPLGRDCDSKENRRSADSEESTRGSS